MEKLEASHAAALYQLPDAWQLRVPAGSSYDHVHTQANAGFNVGHDGRGCSEVDSGINALDGIGSQSCSILVFRDIENANVVALFAGDVSDQRAGFSTTEDDEFHRIVLLYLPGQHQPSC